MQVVFLGGGHIFPLKNAKENLGVLHEKSRKVVSTCQVS